MKLLFSHTYPKLGHVSPVPLHTILPDRLPDPAIWRMIFASDSMGDISLHFPPLKSQTSLLSCQWPSFVTFIYITRRLSEHVVTLFCSLPATSCFIFMILLTFTPGSCRVQVEQFHWSSLGTTCFAQASYCVKSQISSQLRRVVLLKLNSYTLQALLCWINLGLANTAAAWIFH